MASGYRRLRVYELTLDLTKDIYRWTEPWPPKAKEDIGDQLTRAVQSVGAHIAEAGGHSTVANRRKSLGNASSELDEVQHWLAIGEIKGLLPPGTQDRTTEISRLLEGLMKNPGRRFTKISATP